MIEHFPNNRAFFISTKELEEVRSSDFLWSYYCRFRNLIKPKSRTNLVLLWEEDFKKLYDNYRPNIQ